jgi:uncharacterized protein (UPF0128 family)
MSEANMIVLSNLWMKELKLNNILKTFQSLSVITQDITQRKCTPLKFKYEENV